MKTSNSENIIEKTDRLLWKIQHGEDVGTVSVEELDKGLIEQSRLRYTDGEARGNKLSLLFLILEKRGGGLNGKDKKFKRYKNLYRRNKWLRRNQPSIQDG